MSTDINVVGSELTRISSRSKQLNEEVGVTFSNINSTLSEISSIINSGRLTSNNKKLGDTMNIISKNVRNSLISINNFLDDQLSKYTESVADALDALNKLINFIDNTFVSYTPTSQYDASKLHDFLVAYEGPGKMKDGKYVVYVDTDGSLTAGPGIHLSHIKGINVNNYQNGSVIDKSLVDNAVDNLVLNIRRNIENTLSTEQFSDIKLNDAQIDSMTSLLYNTGQSPSYFLKKYKEAQSQGMTLYDYCTSYWVNSGGTKLPGLVKRREAESILFEQGYDAWKTAQNVHL